MVEKTISPSLNAQIDKAVSLIIHSDASIVAAYGFISVLVDLFVKYLLLAGINVFGTRNSYIDIISSIVSLENKKGTLIVINFMNYFRNIIKAEEEARAKGVKVIAITDTHFSPVAIRADVAIIVQLKRPGAIYTLAPVVAVIDEIGTRLSVRKKKKTDEILNLTKQISSEDIYYK